MSDIVMISIDSLEDITIIGDEILIWDGCGYHIDYIECCPDTGHLYMAGGNHVEQWHALPEKLSNE